MRQAVSHLCVCHTRVKRCPRLAFPQVKVQADNVEHGAEPNEHITFDLDFDSRVGR